MKIGFKVKLSVEDQIKNFSRTIDLSVLEWWKKQDREVFDSTARPSKKDLSVKDAIVKLSKFIGNVEGFDSKKSYVWCRGPSFDFPIIKSLYNNAKLSVPYNEFKIRDVRTYIDILHGVDNGKYDLKECSVEFKAHDCLYDAAMDAARLNELYYINSNQEEEPPPF